MSIKEPTILAIETSCDDTSAAVLSDAKIRSNVVSSQIIHAELGGVVPELASRKHLENILVVLRRSLREANIALDEVDAVAFTVGPGLLGSLIVGTQLGKGLALALDKPIIAVDHMQAHILSNFIDPPHPTFPFICLTVSGGHTQLVRVEHFDKMTILGTTLDDAAGEAFDKAGKLLGLPYPAGPHIDRLAKEGKNVYSFPIPRVDGLNFSFSGLKTALLYFLQTHAKNEEDFIEKNKADICFSFQNAIVESLIKKLSEASAMTGIKDIAIAGGVSANSYLKSRIISMAQDKGWNIFIPKINYCTDNAAMIAIAARIQYLNDSYSNLQVEPNPKLKFN